MTAVASIYAEYKEFLTTVTTLIKFYLKDCNRIAAESYTKSFSEIIPSYLFSCNFLTYTKNFTPEQANKNIKKFYENKNDVTCSRLIEDKPKEKIDTHG